MIRSQSDQPCDNLPQPLSSLIGRASDIDGICAQLARSEVRLLTLTGTGGVGKTRLALAVASTVRSGYDEVWLVEFAGLSEPDLVVQEIASTIGVREEPGVSLRSTVRNTLRDKRTLLVLDNCEHLTGAIASIAEYLLAHSPTLTILATSRHRVGVTGEFVWQTRPLAVPVSNDSASAERAVQSDAVQLFLQRAVAVQPDFVVRDESANAIASICQQLDGIPLAIELAARWVTTLSLHEIATRLEDRFGLLVDGTHTGRHHTLRGTIEWSYELLTPEEQLLFNRLSVFAGGCTISAIEAVCSDHEIAIGDIVHILSRLVDASLVIRRDVDGETRFRVLDTLRLFAREYLVRTGEAELLYQSHALFFLDLAERAEPELWGSDLATWLDRLEAEHDNLRAALRWTAGHGEADIALRLAIALGRFWRLRGHAAEGLRWIESALSWNCGVSSTTRARALDTAGQLARDRGAYESAERYYEAALAHRREEQDRPAIALALNNLATIVQFRGNHERSVELLEQSLMLFRELGDERGEALTLVSLGTMAQLQQQIEQAIARYQDGLAVFRRLNDARGIAASLNNLGNLASVQGDYETSNDCYLESLSLFRTLGDEHDVASCLANLARLARDQNAMQRATEYCHEALRGFSALGNVDGIASSVRLLADIASTNQDFDQAVQLLGAVAAVRESAGFNDGNSQDPLFDAMQKRLGTVEFTRAWDSGRARSVEGVIAYALGVRWNGSPTDSGSATTPSMPDPPTRLSRRETDVAGLIARGFTNRKIAEALFISERTVDTHVEHILAKLGVSSRAQVAVWAVEHGLGKNA